MNSFQIDSYEIKNSRSNHLVPVVNGIHLHSIYNPRKEAESFLANHMELFEKKNEILFLGLGFGYHVFSAIEILKKIHNHFKIVVVEPNQKIYDDYMELKFLNDSVVTVYCNYSISQLYSDPEFVKFLGKRPGVISHPPSFNLYREYFSRFLSFKASQTVEEICGNLQSDELKIYLSKFRGNLNLDKCLDMVKENSVLDDDLDFLMMGFYHLESDDSNTIGVLSL